MVDSGGLVGEVGVCEGVVLQSAQCAHVTVCGGYAHQYTQGCHQRCQQQAQLLSG